MTNFSRYYMNTLFIRYMKLMGAFISLKDIAVYSQSPYQVQNAVLGVSDSQILSWWYPDLKSISEETLPPFI
jgi:hypothetical protein